MNPAFLDSMSWEMAEVYGAITDQILINLAGYFPYFNDKNLPETAFAYQAKMLAQMGQVTNQTARIIRQGLSGADDALERIITQAIIDSVRTTEPELLKGVLKGVLTPPGANPIVVSPNQMRAFQLYYQQAADKLNIVNTVMLESTQQAYLGAVSDVVSEMSVVEGIGRIQTALDTAAGETITGVSSWNQAMSHAIDRMKENGITGFIDHAGRRWSAESYAAMDIRTTVANTARAAVWETNQNFGNDLYQVSSHDGARPLCYPWQGKVISSNDRSGVTYDLDGNEITIYAQSDTSYGEPAGLFGINCKHYPTPFIPGVSTVRADPQDEEANEKTYEESQKQRGLERRLREEKRDLMMLKAQNAPQEALDVQRDRVRRASSDIDDFCAETGRARRRNREGVYTKRDFPDADKYNVAEFKNEQQQIIKQYFENGGAQSGYKFGTMTPKAPIAPPPPPAPVQVTPTTPTTPAETPVEKTEVEKRLESRKVDRRKFERYTAQPTETEIIEKLAGADKTKGSCASVGLAYCGNKCGYDVRDFRGGMSQLSFSQINNLMDIAKLDGVVGFKVKGYNDFKNATELLKNVQPGKEYFFTAGKHAAIVRQSATGIDYLEMQSGWRKNTWYNLTEGVLRNRFGCQKSHTSYGMKYEVPEIMIDIDSLQGNQQFANILEFINTETGKEMKGIGGGEK